MQNEDTSFIGELLTETSKIQDKFSQEQEAEKAERENKCPVDVLPDLFKNYAIELSRCLNIPIDYVVISLLSSVSTAIGKGVNLKVKSGWYEYASLFVGIVGETGLSKSHAPSNAFAPHFEADRLAIEDFTEKHVQWEQSQKLSKKDKQENFSEVPKPILQKTVLNDFTPEVVAQYLANNKRSGIIYCDELKILMAYWTNYSKSDTSSQLLTYWSNKPASVDRIKSPIPTYIPCPYLNIIGTTQIRLLKKVFPVEKIDDGHFFRFLFALVEDVEKVPINNNQLDDSIIRSYNKWILDYVKNNPIELEFGSSNKHIVRSYIWDEGVYEYFVKWQSANTALYNDFRGTIKGEVISKFDIHFLRLALIVQVMIDPKHPRISLKAAQAAEKLCAYFMRNTMRILELITSSDPIRQYPESSQDLYHALPENFSTGEAIKIGESLDKNEKFVDRFIAREDLFIRVKHGQYRKKNIK